MAPTGCCVSVEAASPIAPSEASAAAEYAATTRTRRTPVPSVIVVPDSVVTGPAGNSASPMISATIVTIRQVTAQKITIAAYLMASSRARPAGTTSSPRSVPSEASPATASPATTAIASGSISSPSMNVRTTRARNTPLPASSLRNAGPPPPLFTELIVSRNKMPNATGVITSTPSIARLRGRPNTSFSSDRSSRRLALAVDIESLARQLQELVLQAPAGCVETSRRHTSVHEPLADLLGQQGAQVGADIPGRLVDRGQTQIGQYLGRQI